MREVDGTAPARPADDAARPSFDADADAVVIGVLRLRVAPAPGPRPATLTEEQMLWRRLAKTLSESPATGLGPAAFSDWWRAGA